MVPAIVNGVSKSSMYKAIEVLGTGVVPMFLM
jgi:hypothetical protein